MPHQMVVDLLAGRGLAEEERLFAEVRPCQFGTGRKSVLIGQNRECPLGPETRAVAARPTPFAGQKGEVETELPDGGDLLRGLLDWFDPDIAWRRE